MKIICPNCATNTGIRKYLYGMPDSEPDPDKYLVGGCIFDEYSPTYECINCGWQKFKSRFIYDEDDIDGINIISRD